MAQLDYDYISELVEMAQKGDSDAFAELYIATYKKEYRYACGFLRDEYLAQDAVQEAYIRAFNHLSTLKEPRLFVSWLNQINFRVCYDMRLKQQQDAMMTSPLDTAYNLSNGREEAPDYCVAEIDEKSYIAEQVFALPLSESQVIYMHYFQNMKLDDIAYMLDISRSSVKRYLARGKKRLAKMIER